MHPDLEPFLEDAFCSIQPTSDAIGRIVVEPDYDVEAQPSDAQALAAELQRYLETISYDAAQVAQPLGLEMEIPSQYGLLKKYIRQVTLHGNRIDGPWIEVAPPGNWI